MGKAMVPTRGQPQHMQTDHMIRRAFTGDEYRRMAEIGLLHEDDRVELIDGAILVMSPQGSRHVACINRLAKMLEQRIGSTTIVQTQSSIRLDDYTEPQPDIAVLRLQADFYASALPGPDDVLLVIEVADTSLAYDKDTKLPRYANAGIAELWIVDLQHDTVFRYTQPHAGFYAETHQARHGDALQSSVLPNLLLAVDELM